MSPKPTSFRLVLQHLNDTTSSGVVPKAGMSLALLAASEGSGKAVVEASLAKRWQLLTCICENVRFCLSNIVGGRKGTLESLAVI